MCIISLVMKLINFPNCECLHWFRNKAMFFIIEPINGLHVSVFYIYEKNKFFIYPSSGSLYRSATLARQNTKDREIDSRKKEIFLVVECSLKIQFANFWYTLPKKPLPWILILACLLFTPFESGSSWNFQRWLSL